MPGKSWRGTTADKVVLHTLEFNAWPQPERWDSPAHFVYNPNNQELHQYLPTTKAAYAVRDNAQEDDLLTLQVELWGKAANVPGYSDEWYEGVAELIMYFEEEYNIPIEFADFTEVKYGAYAPQRMSDEDVTNFTGFLGHCHMGYGVDTHWDPGMLDVSRVLYYIEGNEMAEPSSWAKASWEWAEQYELVSEQSNPQAEATVEQVITFLHRYNEQFDNGEDAEIVRRGDVVELI